MGEENISQEFRLKNISETRNYFRKEINQKNLNYIEHILILAFAVIKYVSIFAFVSLVDIPVGIASFIVGLIISSITARIKTFKSIIKKKKKKHEKNSVFSKN